MTTILILNGVSVLTAGLGIGALMARRSRRTLRAAPAYVRRHAR